MLIRKKRGHVKLLSRGLKVLESKQCHPNKKIKGNDKNNNYIMENEKKI